MIALKWDLFSPLFSLSALLHDGRKLFCCPSDCRRLPGETTVSCVHCETTVLLLRFNPTVSRETGGGSVGR